MIITPKTRGFICTTAHPIGCAKNVENQMNVVKAKGAYKGPKNVLVIGASTGYGLASRIAATFGAGAKTIGVFFEKPSEGGRTASPGWYNTAAFETLAHQEGYYAKSINGDAFSREIKKQTMALIKQDLGSVDLVIYSLASPRRVHPDTGQVFSSCLKPIHQPFIGKSVDPLRREIKDVHLDPATEEDILNTVQVMGGEDWAMWMDALASEHLLAEGVISMAYDYIGPELTHAIYKNGTIGKAKDHLYKTAMALNKTLEKYHGQAFLSVNKALVTQASAAIPVVPLYISILYKIMKEAGTQEGCIEQLARLLKDKIYSGKPIGLDHAGRIRMDDYEMESSVQQKIKSLWPKVTTENLSTLTDIDGYCKEFYQLFGFEVPGIDYGMDVPVDVKISSLGSCP